MTRSTERPAVTTPPTTDLADATALRHQLADQLAAAGHIRTPAVDHALRTVPRHAFAPEVPLHTAYANDIVATRRSDDGTVISSISAPWLQADMLEAARIQPDHRVLEIGSGGYNAALLAELTGPTGHVTTLDIDPAVTDRATRFLAQTGYDHVRVVTADAEHLPAGVVPDGGFDAIVVTVDTWDLPWIDALAEGGRLVAPLRLHGYHWAIGFTRNEGALHSDEPLIVCGFVAMQGDGAWHTNRRTVPGTGVHLSWEDGTPLSVDQLAPPLTASRPSPTPTSLSGARNPSTSSRSTSPAPCPASAAWKSTPTATTRSSTRRPGTGPPPRSSVEPPPPGWPPNASVTETTARGRYEFVVHGYGDQGHVATQEMAEQVEIWQRNHRGARYPLITASPAAGRAPAGPDHEPHVFAKKHTRITMEWPIVPGSTARPTALGSGDAG
ncbi:methyltransferase domain-containing protein [Streptomyces sp. NPDC056309]|uniref:methyltransferase domain-containing protein n=1 Tax=unclassified Streptomyces TaxID=2593676 RepID=UPI0035E35E0A